MWERVSSSHAECEVCVQTHTHIYATSIRCVHKDTLFLQQQVSLCLCKSQVTNHITFKAQRSNPLMDTQFVHLPTYTIIFLRTPVQGRTSRALKFIHLPTYTIIFLRTPVQGRTSRALKFIHLPTYTIIFNNTRCLSTTAWQDITGTLTILHAHTKCNVTSPILTRALSLFLHTTIPKNTRCPSVCVSHDMWKTAM